MFSYINLGYLTPDMLQIDNFTTDRQPSIRQQRGTGGY